MKRSRESDLDEDGFAASDAAGAAKKKSGTAGQLRFNPHSFMLSNGPFAVHCSAGKPSPEVDPLPRCESCSGPIDPTNSWICSKCMHLICRMCCVPRDTVLCLDCI